MRGSWASPASYVTGVWYGNDNFTPTNKMTGGSLPAQTFKAFNIAATTDMNIPRIPGVDLHPRQQEEVARQEQVRRENPALAAATASQPAASVTRWMPPRTKTFVTNLNKLFKDTPKLDEPLPVPNRGASLTPGGAETAPQ